ncbi:hypothetical protein VTL71DRAFT_4066 [Oculimacula yallundae]|uniref:Uncharacterized protein n=1 Tax=Oculimacula yallundae TaxID=86028 RepID=A0ABR4C5Y6_9HELO
MKFVVILVAVLAVAVNAGDMCEAINAAEQTVDYQNIPISCFNIPGRTTKAPVTIATCGETWKTSPPKETTWTDPEDCKKYSLNQPTIGTMAVPGAPGVFLMM